MTCSRGTLNFSMNIYLMHFPWEMSNNGVFRKENNLQVGFNITELWDDYPLIHWLVLQELLELLGIPVLKAREEAEALCAQLNSEGHVDACITADSDAFLFGAKCVIKCLRPNCKVSFSILACLFSFYMSHLINWFCFNGSILVILEFSCSVHLIKAKKYCQGQNTNLCKKGGWEDLNFGCWVSCT